MGGDLGPYLVTSMIFYTSKLRTFRSENNLGIFAKKCNETNGNTDSLDKLRILHLIGNCNT